MKAKYEKPKIGDRFGNLRINDLNSKKGSGYVQCKCDCGNVTDVYVYNLYSGNTTSCRCQINKIKSRTPTSYKVLYMTYKRNAEKTKRIFDLSFGEFVELISANCFYCGELPKNFNAYLNNEGKQKDKNKIYKQTTVDLAWVKANGIDRVDNSKGYTTDNIVACCETCNFMRGTMDMVKFLNQIDKIHNHNNS